MSKANSPPRLAKAEQQQQGVMEVYHSITRELVILIPRRNIRGVLCSSAIVLRTKYRVFLGRYTSGKDDVSNGVRVL